MQWRARTAEWLQLRSRLMACKKYCMHLFPSYLLVISGFLSFPIAENCKHHFIRTVPFVLSIGKSLSIEGESTTRKEREFTSSLLCEQLNRVMAWGKVCRLHFQTRIKLTSQEMKVAFYLPFVNNWKCKSYSKTKCLSHGFIRFSRSNYGRIIFHPLALTNARINA